MTTILSREAILQAQDLDRELVEVPEWGGAVYVRAMTGMERDAYERRMVTVRGDRPGVNLDGLVNMRAWVAATCIVGEDGERLFSEKDIRALGQKSAAALDRIYAVAMRLSGLTAEDLEELEKN